MTLETFLVELLDSDDDAGAGPGGGEGVLVNPSFEDGAKASLAENTVGAEVPGGGLELVEAEAPHIGRLQNLTLAARGGWHGRRGGDTAAHSVSSLTCNQLGSSVINKLQYYISSFCFFGCSSEPEPFYIYF